MMQKKWGSMERQLLERMIGAVVLLVALVLIVPAILDGGDDDGGGEASPSVADVGRKSIPEDARTRRVEIRPDQPAPSPLQPQPSVANKPVMRPPEEARVKAAPQPAKPPQPVKSAKASPAPAKPAPTPKVKKFAAIKTGWVVQLGSFSSQANAQGLADRVQAKGFAAYLTPVKRSGKTLYRVRVGPSQPSRDKAVKLADDLRRAGYSGQVAEQVAGG
jgi:DedD protein